MCCALGVHNPLLEHQQFWVPALGCLHWGPLYSHPEVVLFHPSRQEGVASPIKAIMMDGYASVPLGPGQRDHGSNAGKQG
eukprot:2666375-Lingulodinium_polyedra.AAC.1